MWFFFCFSHQHSNTLHSLCVCRWTFFSFFNFRIKAANMTCDPIRDNSIELHIWIGWYVYCRRGCSRWLSSSPSFCFTFLFFFWVPFGKCYEYVIRPMHEIKISCCKPCPVELLHKFVFRLLYLSLSPSLLCHVGFSFWFVGHYT